MRIRCGKSLMRTTLSMHLDFMPLASTPLHMSIVLHLAVGTLTFSLHASALTLDSTALPWPASTFLSANINTFCRNIDHTGFNVLFLFSTSALSGSSVLAPGWSHNNVLPTWNRKHFLLRLLSATRCAWLHVQLTAHILRRLGRCDIFIGSSLRRTTLLSLWSWFWNRSERTS